MSKESSVNYVTVKRNSENTLTLKKDKRNDLVSSTAYKESHFKEKGMLSSHKFFERVKFNFVLMNTFFFFTGECS